MTQQVLVTLVYANGTTWFAGGFVSLDAANIWIAAEKTRPYWVSTTQAQITLIPITQ